MSIRNGALIGDEWPFTVWEDEVYTPLVVETPVDSEPCESTPELIAGGESGVDIGDLDRDAYQFSLSTVIGQESAVSLANANGGHPPLAKAEG